MLDSILRTLRTLRSHTSGNATLIVAVGMPALIGGAGLAVDTSQWYMWKRDMQYAVDQAALAGAWAKSSSDTTVKATYATRARQEYTANVSMASAIDATPSVSTAYYGSGSGAANSVVVTNTATLRLPFSSFLTDDSVTVFVRAQASWVPGVAGTSTTTITPARSACLIALNPTASGAFTLGGTAGGSVSCGGAALSNNSAAAIDENGNPNTIFGSLTATGGIAGSLANNVTGGTNNIFANQAGLTNPYAGVATPTGSGVARSYPGTCPTAVAESTTYTATTTPVTYTSYVYVTATSSGGAASNAAAGTNSYTYTPARAASSANGTVANNVVVTSSNTNDTYTDSSPVYTTMSQVLSSPSKVWEVRKVYTRTTYSNFYTNHTPAVSGTVSLLPGTYSSINMICNTSFGAGIYVVTGSIDFSNNKTISGADVLFVMSSANNISNINANTNITLTGISAATLTGSYGYSAANAAKLASMLFWDPLSTSEIKFNGNSTTKLNGIIYTPNRHLWFNGTSSVSGYCMMLVANRLTFNGTTELASFCQTTGATIPEVRPQSSVTTTTAFVPASVKLVG